MQERRLNRFDRERAVERGGHWARLSLLERGVWFVLMRNSDFDSGRVRMAIGTIARLAGITNLHRTRTACQSLEELGLCATVHSGGGRHDAAVREMLAPAPLPGFRPDQPRTTPGELFAGLAISTESGDETGPLTGPVSDPAGLSVAQENRAGERTETGPVSERNRAGERTKTGPVSGPQSEGTHLKSPPPQKGASPSKTGPVIGPVSPTPHTFANKEEEEIFALLVEERKLWCESATALLQGGLTRKVADEVWREVVNDRDVKSRGKVYFRRLCRRLNLAL